MRLLYYLVIVSSIVSCSGYKEKSVLENLTDDELISSLKDNDSTIIRFHSYFKPIRNKILLDDIKRLEYGGLTYESISSYLHKKYQDTLHWQSFSNFFALNSDKYYTSKFEAALRYIDSIFLLNNENFERQYDLKFRGINNDGYILYDITNNSKVNSSLINFSVHTIVDSSLISIRTGYNLISPNEKLRIKSALPLHSLTSIDNQSNRTQLIKKLESPEEHIIYANVNNGEFKGLTNEYYALRIKFKNELSSTLYPKSTMERNLEWFFRDELEETYFTPLILMEIYQDSILDNIANFKKTRRFLKEIDYIEEYKKTSK